MITTTAKTKNRHRCYLGGIVMVASSLVWAAPVEQAVDKLVAANQQGSASQGKIDDLVADTQALSARYVQVQSQSQLLHKNNQYLQSLVDDQVQKIAAIELQLHNIESTNANLIPLMQEMLLSLEQFIALDLPFLSQERQTRLTSLQRLFVQSDISLANKYRSLLEAYQIESDYGRTIETYIDDYVDNYVDDNVNGNVDDNLADTVAGETSASNASGQVSQVQYFRLGRIGWYYLSLDGSKAARFDRQSQTWQPVDNQAKAGIAAGIDMAKQKLAPELLTLPIAAWELAQ